MKKFTLSLALLATIQLLLINSSHQAGVNGVVCKKCRCYALKCSRLDDPDVSCTNKYRDSCDNAEDVYEGDFCNLQCDCCLQNNCYKWNTYACIIFRTFEFANIMYFILITVNAFILWRLYRKMFSKDTERAPDASEDDEEALKEGN